MLLADTGGRLTWNLVDDVGNALAFHFMVNAFRAGTIVAIVAAGIGWFMVLRRETSPATPSPSSASPEARARSGSGSPRSGVTSRSVSPRPWS